MSFGIDMISSDFRQSHGQSLPAGGGPAYNGPGSRAGRERTLRQFEIVEHTADVGLIAYGDTREALFANAALGMFSIIGNPAKVSPREPRPIRAEGDDGETLLAAFLTELLYVFDTEHWMVHGVEVADLSETEVRATARGEPASPDHDLTTEIKAVTHHGLSVRREGGTWRATVLFDI